MRLVDWLGDAVHGPGAARFLIQPAVAIWLAIRDGRRDAKEGFDPFWYRLAFRAGERRGLLHSAWKTLLIPLIVAFVLDSILQAVLMGSYRIRSSVGVAVLLIALPYSLVRAGSCRLWRRRHRRH